MREPVTREPIEVVCADGWRLRGELLVPERPRAVVLVGHAMMVDRRTLDRPRGRGLVSHLASRGFAVVWPDLRGHGQSGPRAEEGGRWGYDELVDGDVPALAAFARARFPSLPVCALGHSLFGHVTLARLARHPDTPIDALALLACNVVQAAWRRRPLDWAAKAALIGGMAALTRLYGRFPSRRLGIGSDDEAADYVFDFARCLQKNDWCARDDFSYAAACASLRRPVIAVVGAGDRLMSPAHEARSLVEAIPGHAFHVVGRASGLPFDPGHMELVLDERARPAWDLVADFLLGAVGA